MMLTFLRRTTASLLDQILLRWRARAENAVSRDRGGDIARITFAEIMAAATGLDFGGFPIEMPGIHGARRDEPSG
jgi:hypothetical protein